MPVIPLHAHSALPATPAKGAAPPATAKRCWRFGAFVLWAAQRRLERDGPPPAVPALVFTALPLRLTRLVGRQAALLDIQDALDSDRLVTLVGTGGIGKTSTAVQAAEELALRQATVQVAFADLSPLSAGEDVPGTVVRALGVATDMADPQQALVQRLAGQQLLLVVDNCEQVDTARQRGAGGWERRAGASLAMLQAKVGA